MSASPENMDEIEPPDTKGHPTTQRIFHFTKNQGAII
jgi:hypothetical protein